LEEETTFSAAKTALGWKNGLFIVEKFAVLQSRSFQSRIELTWFHAS
jgi:hypothetical protein